MIEDRTSGVIIVQREGHDDLQLGVSGSVIQYQFLPPADVGVVSARVLTQSPDRVTCAVRDDCAGLSGGFRLNGLNRIFTRELIRHRPRAVVLRGMHGCVLSLVRVAALFRLPVLLDVPGADLEAALNVASSPWLLDCIRQSAAVVYRDSLPSMLTSAVPDARHIHASQISTFLDEAIVSGSGDSLAFDYSLYEFLLRDEPLLMHMQAPHAKLFSGCQNVLDVGCGAGLFLQLLEEEGIPASGVERNEAIAEYGRATGLPITTADALDFLDQNDGYDGIYCSHFVEHLPMEALERLMRGLASALLPGGVLVLVFPDPESIRSQLLGFWRDPEHVRFYHPELVETLAIVHGLEPEWSSYDDQPHEVVPFALAPTPLPASPAVAGTAPAELTGRSWWDRFIARLGAVPRSDNTALETRLRAMEERVANLVEHNQEMSAALDERTRQLWAVNRTWAWQDNAVLKFRKPASKNSGPAE